MKTWTEYFVEDLVYKISFIYSVFVGSVSIQLVKHMFRLVFNDLFFKLCADFMIIIIISRRNTARHC